MVPRWAAHGAMDSWVKHLTEAAVLPDRFQRPAAEVTRLDAPERGSGGFLVPNDVLGGAGVDLKQRRHARDASPDTRHRVPPDSHGRGRFGTWPWVSSVIPRLAQEGSRASSLSKRNHV